MLITELGIVKAVSAVLRNASLPMLVKPDPKVTDVRLPAPENALLPMLVTESGIVTDVIAVS